MIQKHGKEVENEYLKNAEKQDEINKANAILIRHEKYNEYERIQVVFRHYEALLF